MVDAGNFSATKRTKLGTAECRRLRRAGVTPGNLYGRGGEPIAISVAEDDIRKAILSGLQVVDIEVDGNVDKTVIREIQWDTFSKQIEHVDFLRVDAHERVTVEIALSLRGVAAGAVAGGVLDQSLRSISVDCPVISIPNVIEVKIADLQIGDSLLVKDLDIPEDIKVLTAEEIVVARVTEPIVEEEEQDELPEGPAEPEVIGRKAADADDEQ